MHANKEKENIEKQFKLVWLLYERQRQQKREKIKRIGGEGTYHA